MSAPERPVILLKRGTTDQLSRYVGPVGEILVDTDKNTLVVQDSLNPGGHPLVVAGTEYVREYYWEIQPVVSTAGIPYFTISTLPNSSPTPVSIETGALALGAASFARLVPQALQHHFTLPDDWIGPLDIELVWRASATIGNVGWQVQVGSIRYEDLTSPPLNAPSLKYLPPGVMSDLPVTTTLLNLDVTNIDPADELFFMISRSMIDTCITSAELLSIRFIVRRFSV